MAGVFGTPITNETLEGLPEYDGKTTGAIDRARVAFKWINAESKDVKALQYLKTEWETCKHNNGILCLIYNATGSTIRYVRHHANIGELGSTPYPSIIENGQWGAFLQRADHDNIGVVVYRGKNAYGETRDWMLAWMSSFSRYNTAQTEVREMNNFNGDLDQICQNIWAENRPSFVHSDEWGGCSSFVSIGGYGLCTYRATLTLQNADENN